MAFKSFENFDALTRYMIEKSLRFTEAQKGLQEATLKHPLNTMMGSADVLQLCSNLIQLIGGKKILDIGVYTGASSLAASLAIPDDGKVYALDVTDEYIESIGIVKSRSGKRIDVSFINFSPDVTEVLQLLQSCKISLTITTLPLSITTKKQFGLDVKRTKWRAYWQEAGVEHKIDLRIAPAVDTLQKFLKEGHEGTFDFALIDADKLNYDNYYELSLKLLRAGGIIAIDNTIWKGSVVDPTIQDASTNAIRELNDKLKDDKRINLSMLLIGDGLSLCFKK